MSISQPVRQSQSCRHWFSEEAHCTAKRLSLTQLNVVIRIVWCVNRDKLWSYPGKTEKVGEQWKLRTLQCPSDSRITNDFQPRSVAECRNEMHRLRPCGNAVNAKEISGFGVSHRQGQVNYDIFGMQRRFQQQRPKYETFWNTMQIARKDRREASRTTGKPKSRIEKFV